MNNKNIPNKILHWYDNNKRILPWRKKVSQKQKEYFTFVSEFMLQQTQVKLKFLKISTVSCQNLMKS
jgi:A/G-specific adenine glycosylase